MKSFKKWLLKIYINVKRPETIVALLIGVIGTLTANLIWDVSHTPVEIDMPVNQLTIYTDSAVSLLKKNIVSPDLTITFRDREVESLYLYEFTFQNTGQEPISIEDYNVPLVVKAQNSIFLLADIKNCNSNLLRTQISEGMYFEDGNLMLPKVMLNSQDYFSISFLMDGPTNFSVDGRIKGISKINFQNRTIFAQNQARLQNIRNTGTLLMILVFVFITLLIAWLFILPFIKSRRLKRRLETKYSIKIPKNRISDLGMYDRIIEKYKSEDKEWDFMKGKTDDELLLYLINIAEGDIFNHGEQTKSLHNEL